MKILKPKVIGKKLMSNNTHIAIRTNNEIQIWIFGLNWINDDNTISNYPAELLYTIPIMEEDDLFAIFERFEEDNRINRNCL